MNNDLISREALKKHKFLTPQVKVIGGRHDGKMREQIIQAYQKGWNDCIDEIIDNAPTVELEELKEIRNICEHWSDKSSSFVSACNAFEDILHIFRLGVDDMKGGAE